VSRLSKLLVEMHRRRVFRVAALYIVGAWIVLQVADLAFASWDIPSSALRHVWIGAMLVFPIALIFGWRFDIVGGRIIRTQDSDAAADMSLHRTDYSILLALAAVIVAMVYGVGAEISSVRVPRNDEVLATSINPKSIAILPFKTTSTGDENAGFLAGGIQDDLLTRLSKITALTVVSRTSVERYRDTAKSIRRIGRELGVGRILEGSVQRAGDRIRVNVQLIDTQTGDHLWAEIYNRNLTASNVFEMQSEIVGTIARQLKANLTPRETRQLAAMPTTDLAAYTAYLRGRHESDIESVESLYQSIDSFRMAVELDPGFALAYVGLADAYLALGAYFYGGLPIDESVVLAEPPLVKALELDRNLGQAQATLGFLRQQQGDLQAAEQAYDRAIALQPSYSRVLRLYGRLRWRQGRIEDALQFLQRALTLDPFSAPVHFSIARIHDESGDFEAAMAGYRRVVEFEPDHAFAYVYIAAIHYLVYGRADESLVWYYKAAENDALSPSLRAALALPYLELGDPDSAREWVNKGRELGPNTFWTVWASLLLNHYLGSEVAARQDARTLLDIFPRNWGALNLLRNADLAAGRNEVARSRYARAFPELTEPELPEVQASNYRAAVDLALVLQRMGEVERADDLLERSMEVIRKLPRLGTNGYWIADVRILALQRQPQRALRALRQAVDEGWRFLTWYQFEHDPNLDSIRGSAEFQRLYVETKTDLAAQARHVLELKESGELPAMAMLAETAD